MPSTPTPSDDLSSVLQQLADRLDSLEVRLDRIEASAGPTIASISTPFPPSKAKPAKKERPTRKGAIPYATIPLPLAQTFPIEGKTNHHLVMVVIPDSGQCMLLVNTYTLADGPNDECHISIRGTNLQIGDALVVLGKQITRKKVHPPKLKKTGPAKGSTNPARPNPIPTFYYRLLRKGVFLRL
ncbi:hypothetical protein BYT27DRAFT_7247456 [Phlegmacium glaucopus]|nr:hypothetical protein BYT27DRAFT_7247456 [Phlegmacium glaucopus]